MMTAQSLPHDPALSVQPSSASHPSQPSLSLLNQFSPRDHNTSLN